MNINLLEQIIEAIDREPQRFDMEFWSRKVKPTEDSKNTHSCYTTQCIAGWAVVIDRQLNPLTDFAFYLATNPQHGDISSFISNGLDIEETAQEAIGLDEDDAERLFFVGSWPFEFREPYYNATSDQERATIAIARIRHFIETYGEE
ncbi:hypothetical protein K9N68_37530 (plasmid) [Kovacikia minuta CCNUW1]|uniref:hypothetical protein n=1 Tax=Kovacikia minuta TaxID=2931930 RepID=UPI001CCE766E|nr:hypothetical protein [Kovacikia minuta]UBF29915.1 hypothetical protein K9N68_37530 [Kovacikia minuta CCNUW1]